MRPPSRVARIPLQAAGQTHSIRDPTGRLSMPANRTAALGAALTAAVTALVTLLGAIPSPTGKAIVVSVALIVFGAIAIVFLLGYQKHEARIATPKARATRTEPTKPTGSSGATVTTSTKPKPGGGATAISNVSHSGQVGFR